MQSVYGYADAMERFNAIFVEYNRPLIIISVVCNRLFLYHIIKNT